MKKENKLINYVQCYGLKFSFASIYLLSILYNFSGEKSDFKEFMNCIDEITLDNDFYYSPVIIDGKEDSFYDELLDHNGIRIGYIYVDNENNEESDSKCLRRRIK